MLSIQEIASKAVGNFKHIPNYADFSEFDPRYWTMFHLDNRDSDVLEQSNAAMTRKELDAFADDTDKNHTVEFSSASHWACGYVNTVYIRVYDAQGEITPAFKTYYALQERLEDYPILDEEDFSRREWESAMDTWKYISTSEKKELKARYHIPARLQSFHSVMNADNGGLFQYLTTP